MHSINNPLPDEAMRFVVRIQQAILSINNGGRAERAHILIERFIKKFPQYVREMNTVLVETVSCSLMELCREHIFERGTAAQRKAYADASFLPMPTSHDRYIETATERSEQLETFVHLLCSFGDTEGYIARRKDILAQIDALHSCRDEAFGLITSRLRSLLIHETVAALKDADILSFGDSWRYELWRGYHALPADDKPLAFAFAAYDDKAPGFCPPSQLNEDSDTQLFTFAAYKLEQLSGVLGYKDMARMVKTLCAAVRSRLRVCGVESLVRLDNAMRETFKDGSLSFWEQSVTCEPF